jgi:hypothetical protein
LDVLVFRIAVSMTLCLWHTADYGQGDGASIAPVVETSAPTFWR